MKVAHRSGRPTFAAGFTLLETLAAVSMAGVLSTIAIPALQSHLHKARRADALVSMMQIELSQARWRANDARYASLAEIGMTSASPAGHYRLEIAAASDAGYEALAIATGGQAGDVACRHLKLTVGGGNVVRSSGPDASVANPPAANRQCWNR